MFQKFDEESQKVLLVAKKEMMELKHEYVGSEHVILAMLKISKNISKLLNVSYNDFRNSLIEAVGIGKNSNDLFLYTPLLKRVLERAIITTRERGVNVGLKDILFSILEEGEGVGIRVLLSLNVDIEKVYYNLIKEIPKSKVKKKGILDELGVNLNDKVKDNTLDPVIGREKEINRVIEILCRRTKNNPILIGEAGVGKTAIVEGLTEKIVLGDVPDILKNKKIINLDMASLVAGTRYRGEFEDRMRNLLLELEDDEDIILFIDEIHTIMGAGGAEGAIDASNIIKPALARGKMRLIGATTIDEYKKYIEVDSALDRRFQKVEVFEPDEKTLKNILLKLKEIYEKHHNVVLKDELIDKIIKMSKKYIKNRKEPDKSIDILDEVCSRVSILKSDSDLNLSKLKNELNSVLDEKNKLIADDNYKKAFELKKKENIIKSKINNIELLNKSINKDVTEKDILDVIKSMMNVPLLGVDDSYLSSIKSNLNKTIIGQDNVINELINMIKSINNFDNSFSILLCGKMGVGKSFLANNFSKLMVGENNVIKLDMKEFSDSHSISKIVGAMPGYVGYSDSKNLLEKIKDKPNSILILDEIENSDLSILKLFLQGITDGYIKDSMNKKIDLSNVIIIMTTNIDISNNTFGFNNNSNISFKDKIKNYFGSDIMSNITKILLLNDLKENDIRIIIDNNIKELKVKYDVDIKLSNSFIKKLIDLSEYEVCGAKRIKELIKYNVESVVIDDILNNKKNIFIDDLSMTTI